MKTTEWRTYEDNLGRFRIRVEYGMRVISKQEPHFSITAEIQMHHGKRWEAYNFGMLHEEIRTHFPELAGAIRWHFFTWPSGPMHYISNAIYWWQKIMGRSKWPAQPGETAPSSAFRNKDRVRRCGG